MNDQKDRYGFQGRPDKFLVFVYTNTLLAGPFRSDNTVFTTFCKFGSLGTLLGHLLLDKRLFALYHFVYSLEKGINTCA